MSRSLISSTLSLFTSREEVKEEDPIQRELRLRAEAKERLQKKFGSGGLGSQAVGSSPIPPGGYGNQPQQQTNDWGSDE